MLCEECIQARACIFRIRAQSKHLIFGSGIRWTGIHEDRRFQQDADNKVRSAKPLEVLLNRRSTSSYSWNLVDPAAGRSSIASTVLSLKLFHKPDQRCDSFSWAGIVN